MASIYKSMNQALRDFVTDASRFEQEGTENEAAYWRGAMYGFKKAAEKVAELEEGAGNSEYTPLDKYGRCINC